MKEAIADTAEEMALSKGLAGLTMDDVAGRLGISKKTIYAHFSSKQELVDFLVMRRLHHVVRNIDKTMQAHSNVIQVFVDIMRLLPEMMGMVNPVIFDELKSKYRATWKKFEEIKQKHMMASLMYLLEKGKKQGYFRKSIHSDILVQMRFLQVESTFSSSAYPFQKYTFNQIHQELLEHFLYGICTLKGFQLYEKLKKRT
ncbi:MAG: TetR/AcrR family transcriptional regulator [Bacteroidia bacterium]|nr:TetR/AcrR family transcriptional regulator [Bacteroidia bacterium]